jgi:hypothetical protein
MSKRLDVLRAALALAAAALPGWEVVGLTAAAAKPTRVPAGGRAVLREGDPGQAEIDLSPLAYNYTHAIPIELDYLERPGGPEPTDQIDAALVAIGTAVAANRTLGGLCHWIDAELPSVDEANAEGARGGSATTLIITAHYTTTNPLN